MTEPTVNIPLLRKAVEWAEAEAAKPWELSEWYQGMWVSNPTSVIADDVEEEQFGVAVGTEKSPECGTCYCIAGYICSVEGVEAAHSWDDYAAKALNLRRDELCGLFYADNTIADVRRIAESIAGERL